MEAGVPRGVQEAMQGDAQVALDPRVRAQLDNVLQAAAAMRAQRHAAQLLPPPGRRPMRKGDGRSRGCCVCKGHLRATGPQCIMHAGRTYGR